MHDWLVKLDVLEDAAERDPHAKGPDLIVINDDFVESARWEAFGLEKPQTNTVKNWITGETKGAAAIRERFKDTGMKDGKNIVCRWVREPSDEK
jgi:hypothetical protein